MLLSNAISFVRARLDEIAFNNDDMILAAQDDRNLDTTIERLLPEAVEVVLLSAPEGLLQPQYEVDTTVSPLPVFVERIASDSTAQTIEVELSAQARFIRLVYFKAGDSDVYLTKAAPYDSPLARQQANPYTKGTPDLPALIQRNLLGWKVLFTYYGTESSQAKMGFISKAELQNNELFCPVGLENAALNELTAKVLEAYNDQRSQLFHQKANGYLGL